MPVITSDQTPLRSSGTGDRRWAMAGHLLPLCLFLGKPLLHILAPYLMRRHRRGRSQFSANHPLESFHFQLSLTLYALMAFLMGLVASWGWIALAVIATVDIFLVGVASDRGRGGRPYRYPVTIRWISPLG